MSNFFTNLVNENLIADWASTLDWIFDDSKFSDKIGWNAGYVSVFTKKLKHMNGIKGIEYYTQDQINKFTKRSRKQMLIAFVSKGDSEGKAIVKHIRNGIAHGNTDYKNITSSGKQELFIEIKDYKADGKTQTAYIFFPIYYIVEIHKLYLIIEKSIRNNKPSGRKTKKHIVKDT